MREGFLQGTLEILILKTLTWGPMHGYGVARSIGERSGGDLEVEDAALYRLEPVAHERQGAVQHHVHGIVEVGAPHLLFETDG